MKLEELESVPNKSLKSLTDGSVLGLNSVSVLTGIPGREGIAGSCTRGMPEFGSGRSKSGSKRACCNLEAAGGMGSGGLDGPELDGPNPRIDCKDLLSSFGLGGCCGIGGFDEYPGLGG